MNTKFEIKENGIFVDNKKISDYVQIVGSIKTQSGKDWKTRLEFKDM